MTTAVKSADPNHLVSLGTIGGDQCGLVGSDYKYVHSGRVDVCEYHDYGVVTRSIPGGADSLAQRIAQCAALHKPMFIGEVRNTSRHQRLRSLDRHDHQHVAAAAGRLLQREDIRSFQRRARWLRDLGEAAGRLEFGHQLPRRPPIVGPDDPTNEVTAMLSRTFGTTPGSLRFSFEDGRVDGWRTVSGSGSAALSNSTVEAWDGTHSLLIVLRTRARSVTVATSATGGAGPGSTITYHLYLPSDAPSDVAAAPYVLGGSGLRPLGASTPLLPGWNVLQWTIPRSISEPLRSIGVEINNQPRLTGLLLLDDVSW